MMKLQKKFAMSMVALASVFAGSVFAGDLEVALPYDRVGLREEALRSCALQITDPGMSRPNDIPGLSAWIGGIALTWKGSAPLDLTSVEVVLEGPGLNDRQIVVVAQEELAYLWAGSAQTRAILPGTQITTSANCGWAVGGFRFSESIVGTAHVIVNGITLQHGLITHVSAAGNFHYSYLAPQDRGGLH